MANNRTFHVEEPTELLPFLLEKLPEKGRNKVKGLLTHRQVNVRDKVVTRHDVRLMPGDVVTIVGTGPGQKAALHGIRILYEDDDILVIDKPPGLLSISTDDGRDLTAYRILMDYVRITHPENRVFIVHRLDRDTSGLMMFSKSESVQQALQHNWKDTVQERLYVAVVEGTVNKTEDTIKCWLKQSSTHTMYVCKPGDGMLSVTRYQTLKTTEKYSLLQLKLETGRKNQIRVHMQSIGHSVLGDKRYGAKMNPLDRLALHARVLNFRHPVTDEVLQFETSIPPAFKSLFPNKRR